MTEREQIFADAVTRQAKRSIEWVAAVKPVASDTKNQSEQGQSSPQGKRRRAPKKVP
jgi:hypothetical protein